MWSEHACGVNFTVYGILRWFYSNLYVGIVNAFSSCLGSQESLFQKKIFRNLNLKMISSYNLHLLFTLLLSLLLYWSLPSSRGFHLKDSIIFPLTLLSVTFITTTDTYGCNHYCHPFVNGTTITMSPPLCTIINIVSQSPIITTTNIHLMHLAKKKKKKTSSHTATRACYYLLPLHNITIITRHDCCKYYNILIS